MEAAKEQGEKPGVGELVELARRIRIRLLCMVAKANGGHLGGSLSAVEILTALYFRFLRLDPSNPSWALRDRFVLSKGHATPLYYAVLSARGYFPDDWLEAYDSVGSPLQGHPDMTKTPGVDMTTGSLGQGFSSAVGMSIGARLLGMDFRVVVLTGDGELQEGQVWEAAMYAGAHRLSNLVCIMDHNKLQLASSLEDGLTLAPLADKWRAFGWRVMELNGNRMEEVVSGLENAFAASDGPVALIAHTVKGKGVSFMEQAVKWHSAVPSRAEMACALRELGATAEEIEPWLR